jgi:hypothetical protein
MTDKVTLDSFRGRPFAIPEKKRENPVGNLAKRKFESAEDEERKRQDVGPKKNDFSLELPTDSDFSDFFHSLPTKSTQNQNNPICPPTPVKRGSKVSNDTPLMATCREIAKGNLNHHGHSCKTVPVSGGEGDYKQAYTVHSDRPLIAGYANEDILVLAFRADSLHKHSSSHETVLRNGCEQHNRLIGWGCNVAKILNVNTAPKDGYYIVERIPYSAADKVHDWANEQAVEDLDPKVIDLLTQVRAMFNLAVEKEECMDLKPASIRYNEKNNAFLTDVMEEKYLKSDVAPRLKTNLLSWAKGNSHVFAFLTEDIVKENNPKFRFLFSLEDDFKNVSRKDTVEDFFNDDYLAKFV